MNPKYIDPNWKAILTHESGHAVAALVLHNEVANIRLRGSTPGGSANRASYSLRNVEDGFVPDSRPPLEIIMVYAAGAKAEEVLLGITQSEGFNSDRRRIEAVRDKLNRDADVDVDHLKSLGFTSERLSEALVKVSDAKTKLAAVELEISSNYPRTAELIARHRNAVELIARRALERLQEVNQVDGAILLSADQVQSLWAESQLGTHVS